MDFWAALERLIAADPVVVDRPQGSVHPRYADIIYLLDYGYLDGTTSGDGKGIDVWLGSGNRKALTGVIRTVGAVKQDTESKVLPGCTKGETHLINGLFPYQPDWLHTDRAALT